MNLPNALTLMRIFFVPFLVAVMVQEDASFAFLGLVLTNEMVALVIFLAAAFTDLLDGYLARRWNQITTVGMLLDPVADKLLISAALIGLVLVHRVPSWMAVLIIGREFAVSGLRSIAASEGYTTQASELGKTKMVTQVLAISLTVVAVDQPWLASTARFMLWGTLVFALASAADYAHKFWRRIDESIKERRRIELLRLEKTRQRDTMKAAAAARGERTL